jgi:peroxiredoxin
MFSRQIKTLLLSVLLLLLASAASALDIGSEAPGFTLKNLKGEEVSLADYKGQPVLLKLATTWCHTCQELSAEILELNDYLKEKNVAVIEVFVQDSPEMVEKSLEGKAFTMPFQALLDDGQAYRAYNIYLIPRMLLLDAELKVRFDTTGRVVSAKEIRELVEQLPVAEPVQPAAAEAKES